MALQLTVDSLDSIPENLRELYTEKDGKFLLAVEGMEDTSGLKSALQKEREAARNAEKQAKAWASLGKSPEEIQELLEAQRKAEEEKATKAGEWDKLKAQMNDKHLAELTARDEAIGKAKAALERHLIVGEATKAIAGLKGIPELLLPHVQSQVRVIEEDGDYQVRVVDAKGNPRVNGKGDFLSITDLVSEMRQSEIFGRAFEASGTSGSGAPGSNGGHGGKTIKRSDFDALSPAEQAAKAREYKIVD